MLTIQDIRARLEHAQGPEHSFTARCPAHDDRENSLSVTQGDHGRVLLHCHAGCTYDAIVRALDIKPGDLCGPPRDRRRIVATYDYTDAAGTLLYQVVRQEPKHFFQRRPDPVAPGQWINKLEGIPRVLYRLPEVLAATKSVFVVEGEKDADNLRALGCIATTNAGGAGKWRPEYTAVLAKLPHVIIIPDADKPGTDHARTIRAALPDNSAILELPGQAPKQDVSDWLARGGTLDALRALVRQAWAARNDQPLPVSSPPAGNSAAITHPTGGALEPTTEPTAEPTADAPAPDADHEKLATDVEDGLNRRPSRADKQNLCRQITEHLIKRGLLLWDPAANLPYLKQDGLCLPLDDSPDIRVVLHSLRVNATELIYRWIVAHLQAEATTRGVRVTPHRYAHIGTDAVYISSGPRAMLRVGRDIVTPLPNGEDGILFSADSVYPVWEPSEPEPPRRFQGFQALYHSPDESPNYTPENQARLLEAWMVCATCGVKPLPLLVVLGQAGSGKTTLARAIIRALRGIQGDVVGLSEIKREMETLITGQPVTCLDNVDTEKPPEWFHDLLTMCATGGRVESRKLYTNNEVSTREISAALMLTCRTPHWADHADIQERLCPLHYGSRENAERRDDSVIEAEILHPRSGIMSWVAEQAVRLLDATTGHGSRFQRFAHVATGMGADVPAMHQSAQLSVSEIHPVIDCIIHHDGDLIGSAKEIMDILIAAGGGETPHIGGPKRLANLIREHRRVLECSGMTVTLTKWVNTTRYALTRRGNQADLEEE